MIYYDTTSERRAELTWKGVLNLCFRARQHHRSLTLVMNDFWWLRWPMISRDGWGLSFPDICLTVEEESQRKPQPGKLTRPGIEPGPGVVRDNDVTPRQQRWSGKVLRILTLNTFSRQIVLLSLSNIIIHHQNYHELTNVYPIFMDSSPGNVGEVTEGLENELWHRWSDVRVEEWDSAVASTMSQLILQPIRRFSYVNSFYNPSVASTTSQLILQPFRRFTYVSSFYNPSVASPTSPSEPPMPILFCYFKSCTELSEIKAVLHWSGPRFVE